MEDFYTAHNNKDPPSIRPKQIIERTYLKYGLVGATLGAFTSCCMDNPLCISTLEGFCAGITFSGYRLGLLYDKYSRNSERSVSSEF